MGLVCYYCGSIGIITTLMDGKEVCELCEYKAHRQKKVE